MKRDLAAFAAALLCASFAHAQTTDVLIEVDTGRTEGLFTKKPVMQRAILAKPEQPTDTALLYFRGYPGIARIESAGDKQRNLQAFMRMNQRRIANAGIALVVMDCPTDQWGMVGQRPTACFDNYRASAQHAEDVRKVMARLREEHGLTRVFIMGHSMGSISSRWLAVRLGNEIAGSIHSSSMNKAARDGFAQSASDIPYAKMAAPVLHVHNQNDACEYTRYSWVTAYAGDNLLTVRGGVPQGDPCGGGHFHSFQGREEAVVTAIIAWIKTGKTERVVGE
jgi:hypothetical protein